MAVGDIQINTIILPSDGMRYSPGRIDFEVRDRTMDRTLVSDFVTIKYKATITWEYPVSGTFMADILELYLAKEDVTVTITESDASTTVYTCRIGVNDSNLRDISSGVYAFSGFTITLEEV